jgi:hypothetical protein
VIDDPRTELLGGVIVSAGAPEVPWPLDHSQP